MFWNGLKQFQVLECLETDWNTAHSSPQLARFFFGIKCLIPGSKQIWDLLWHWKFQNILTDSRISCPRGLLSLVLILFIFVGINSFGFRKKWNKSKYVLKRFETVASIRVFWNGLEWVSNCFIATMILTFWHLAIWSRFGDEEPDWCLSSMFKEFRSRWSRGRMSLENVIDERM
jgi:hypothetical protein